MENRNRMFDDAARVAGGALGTLAGVRREVEGLVRHQLDRLLSTMDLVTRDEFEAAPLSPPGPNPDLRYPAAKAGAPAKKQAERACRWRSATGPPGRRH